MPTSYEMPFLNKTKHNTIHFLYSLYVLTPIQRKQLKIKYKY